MYRPSGNVDRAIAPGVEVGLPENPPSSAWGTVALADEDDGFDDFDLFDGDDWPGQWGAARLGIP